MGQGPSLVSQGPLDGCGPGNEDTVALDWRAEITRLGSMTDYKILTPEPARRPAGMRVGFCREDNSQIYVQTRRDWRLAILCITYGPSTWPVRGERVDA
jgi:hypothetical protein